MKVKILHDCKFWFESRVINLTKDEVILFPDNVALHLLTNKIAKPFITPINQEIEDIQEEPIITATKRGRKQKIQDKSLHHENE